MNRKHMIFFLFLLLGILFWGYACQRVTTTEYTVDSGSCNGCGECVRICPNDAVYLNHAGKAEIDPTKCTNCANCVAICPNSAIY